MSTKPAAGQTSASLPGLDHLRWLATFACTFGHAVSLVLTAKDRSLPAKLLTAAGDLSHPALITFFVLSGFLIGGRTWRLIAKGSSPADRRKFIVDRFIRVAIVLWPALALSALLVTIAPLPAVGTGSGWDIDHQTVFGRMSVEAWAGAAFLVNGLLTPKCSVNGPLWSMAFEWTYYVFAAAAICLAARDRSVLGIGLIGYALLLVGVGLFGHLELLWMLGYWVAGMVASRIRNWHRPAISIGLFAVALLATGLHRQSIWCDTAVAVATAVLLADRAFQGWRFAPALAKRFASISYSVYAIHWPTMVLVWACLRYTVRVPPRLPFGAAACLSIALLTLASYAMGAILARFTENYTDTVRTWILDRHGFRSIPVPRQF